MLDVDGVLVHGRPDGQPFVSGLQTDLGVDGERLQDEFFRPHWEAIVTGKEPMKGRLAAVLDRIAPHVAADDLIAYWFATDTHIDADVLAAACALRTQGWRVFLATNQEHVRAAYLMETLGLGAKLDGIVYSAALGHHKPANAFFRSAEKAVSATPDQLVLIDDAAANIEAARRCGWTALHWTKERTLPDLLSPYL
jgi:putative hydrolase of the HAD superfamily